MLELNKIKRLMVVVAHPDDELLGIGGTLYKLKSETNCTIKVVILGEGITSRSFDRNSEESKLKLKRHKQNIISAKNIIGYDELVTYQFPDNQFDTLPLLSIIKAIEKEKNKFKPEIVFTHHIGDVNIDHQLTFQAVNTAFRSQPKEYYRGLLTFETPSGTEWRASSDPKHFTPNMYVEVSKKNVQAKIKGMESYDFEKRKYPHPRSPEALNILAQYRGITVGKEYAEAFYIVRSIN